VSLISPPESPRVLTLCCRQSREQIEICPNLRELSLRVVCLHHDTSKGFLMRTTLGVPTYVLARDPDSSLFP